MGWRWFLIALTWFGAAFRSARGLNVPLYAAVARLGFRRQFAYLQAALWGMITNLFFGMLRISVLLALFGSQARVAGFTVQDAVTFTALTQVFITAFSLFGWFDFMRAIHRGEVVTDLLRPSALLGFWTAQDAGRACGQFLLRGVPMLLLFGVLWGVKWPPEPLLTLLSILLAWACGFAFRFLVNCAAFWSADAVGIGRFAWSVWGLCCGFLMPLAFFPDWFRRLLEFTPFPSMLNTVVELWLGHRVGVAAWESLGTQLFWTLVMFALAGAVLARGLKRLEVAGG